MGYAINQIPEFAIAGHPTKAGCYIIDREMIIIKPTQYFTLERMQQRK